MAKPNSAPLQVPSLSINFNYFSARFDLTQSSINEQRSRQTNRYHCQGDTNSIFYSNYMKKQNPVRKIRFFFCSNILNMPTLCGSSLSRYHRLSYRCCPLARVTRTEKKNADSIKNDLRTNSFISQAPPSIAPQTPPPVPTVDASNME